MRKTKESLASIAVLAIIVIVALIAGIVGTVDAGSRRFLSVLGILSLFGLLRHGLRITSEMFRRDQERLRSLAVQTRQISLPATTPSHEANFLRDREDFI